ncbi:MAG: peptidase U32 family protein [Candidatus Woesearchaeota archaeon]
MKPELMAPVSDWPSLTAAVEAGADSVYCGLKELNMRATARNFERTQLPKVVEFCHSRSVKVYLTLNTIIYEKEIPIIKEILDMVRVDAIICWDMAVITEARKRGIPVILSTQASVSNSTACNAYKELGVKRVVLARECTLEQISSIRKETDLELEVFAHGAMCVSVSGRCFLSQFLFNRSANRGDCLQPCRRAYIVKDPEEGHELSVSNHYIFSPQDLCILPFIDEVIETGIDCLKIEGRARSPEYVKTVTSAYRKAIDAFHDNTLTTELKDSLVEECRTVFNRGFSPGFFFGRPADWTTTYGSQATTRKVYLGEVKKYYQKIGVAEFTLETNPLQLGERIMFQGKTTGVKEQTVESLQKNHKPVEKAEKGERIALRTDFTVRPRDKVFLIN